MSGAGAGGARLARLVRYPVKGFGGQDLDTAVLQPGRGLPHDRALAVTNGTTEVEPGGAWTACQAFVRLTRNTDLPRYRLQSPDAPHRHAAHHAASDPEAGDAAAGDPACELMLVGPDGRQLRVPLGDAGTAPGAEEVLSGWFPSGPLGLPRLVAAEQGLWDHQDAVLSIINLETVRELQQVAGQVVDPLRFRANLYLSGLPAWQELSMVGRRVRVGDVELEVLRPTDRCRATSVDPTDASTDLNVPALLGARYGHLYCGVYARVVRGGRIRPGQRLLEVAAAPSAVRDGAATSTAPPPGQWPRPMQVTSRVQESPTVTSYWLTDPLAALRPPPLPGQHLRVHATDAGGPLWRSYTVSGVEGDRLRISVKHGAEDARMPHLLHSTAHAGSELLVTGPFGDATLAPGAGPPTGGPVLLASAGIGITPSVAVLRGLAAQGSSRPVLVLHVARDGGDLALWPEVLALTTRLPGTRAELFLTRPSAEGTTTSGTAPTDPTAQGIAPESPAPGGAVAGTARRGRPTEADLVRLTAGLDPAGLVAHLCGPAGFTRELHAMLLGLGAAPERVHTEVFASPSARAGVGAAPPLPGPFAVGFTTGGVDATWTAGSGSLLDVAEAAGLALPAGCRAGACGSCAQTLTGGSVAYTTEPVLAPPLPKVLLCCAVPTADVQVQA